MLAFAVGGGAAPTRPPLHFLQGLRPLKLPQLLARISQLAHFQDFAFFQSQHGPTRATAVQRSFFQKHYIISASLFGNVPYEENIVGNI